MTNKLPVVGKRYILKFLKHKGSVLELLRLDDSFVEMKYPDNQIEKYFFPKEDFWKIFEELPEDSAKEGEGQTFFKKNNKEIWKLFKELDEYSQYELNQNPRRWFTNEKDSIWRKALEKTFDLMWDFRMARIDDAKQSLQDLEEILNNRNGLYCKFEHWTDYLKPDIDKLLILIKESKIFEEIKEKEESIWKPVSELPYNYAKVILKIKAGTHYYLEAFFKDDEFYDEELRESFDNLPIRKECIKEWCYKFDPLKDYEKLKERVKKLETLTK